MISIARFPFRRVSSLAALAAFLGTFVPGFAGAAGTAQEAVSPLVIQHEPLACVTTSASPVVDASITPDRDLAKSYVYFRAAGNEDFYYVLMSGTAPSVEGVLPRPLPETKTIDYFVRATDTGQLSRKTPDYMPPVVADNVCRTRGKAVPPAGAGLTIGLTREGQAPAPPGFNRRDIAFVILVSGAIVTLAAALQAAGAGAAAATGGTASGTAAAGGGVSTGVIVGGGVAVAAGAAAIAVNNSRGGSSNSPPTISITASPTTGTAPLYVSFNATVTDKENDTPYSVHWSFGDGAQASGMTASHTYAGTGNFSVTATATDSKGKTGTSNAVTIAIPGPQAIVASVSWAGHAGLSIQVLDPSGNPVGQPAGPSDPCANQEVTRTEQVLLDAPNLTAGTYTVAVTGASCPGTTPPDSVTAIGSVVTSAGAVKCASTQVSVPIPTAGSSAPVALCTFPVP